MFADLLKDRENRYAMINSGIVWAHQQAASARKKGLRRQFWSGAAVV
jgi:hypothetical protein